MTIQQIRDLLIEEGIKSVHEHETSPERIRGALDGFELCRNLETPEQFLALLGERRAEEHRLLIEKVPHEEYWEYHIATEQIAFVWERIRVAIGHGQTFSARAVIHISQIYMQVYGKHLRG